MTKVHPLSTDHDMARRHARSLVIANEYAGDKQVSEIAAEYGLSTGTVCNIARRHGIRKRYCGFTTKIRDRVIALYKDPDVPIKDIVAETKIDRKTVWKIVKTAKLKMRYRKRVKK